MTARSFGARLRRFLVLAQRAASTSSAVESEPPETARRSPRRFSRPLNSALASSSLTAWSAMATLLFSVHGSASRSTRRADICAAPRRAKRRPLPFRPTPRATGRAATAPPAPAPSSRIWSNGEERFGGVAILLLLEQTFAQPVLRLRRQAIARILAQEAAERLPRPAHSPCAGRSRRRDRIRPWASCSAAASPAWRRCALGLLGGGAGSSPRRRRAALDEDRAARRSGGTGRGRVGDRRRRLGRGRAGAEWPRRTRRVRIGRRIEGVAAADRRMAAASRSAAEPAAATTASRRLAAAANRAAAASGYGGGIEPDIERWAAAALATVGAPEPLPSSPRGSLRPAGAAPAARAAGCGTAIARCGR